MLAHRGWPSDTSAWLTHGDKIEILFGSTLVTACLHLETYISVYA